MFSACWGSYPVGLGVAQPLLLQAQVTHLGHQLVGVHEETRAEQEGENVGSLKETRKDEMIHSGKWEERTQQEIKRSVSESPPSLTSG